MAAAMTDATHGPATCPHCGAYARNGYHDIPSCPRANVVRVLVTSSAVRVEFTAAEHGALIALARGRWVPAASRAALVARFGGELAETRPDTAWELSDAAVIMRPALWSDVAAGLYAVLNAGATAALGITGAATAALVAKIERN